MFPRPTIDEETRLADNERQAFNDESILKNSCDISFSLQLFARRLFFVFGPFLIVAVCPYLFLLTSAVVHVLDEIFEFAAMIKLQMVFFVIALFRQELIADFTHMLLH